MTNSQNENDILLWRNDNSATPRMIAKSLRIWHKKETAKAVSFFGGDGESRTHVLLGCQKTFYILISSIIS